MPELPWNSLSQFVHMDGKGLYVWGSLGLGLAGMVLEALLVRRRDRRAWRREA
ncbi:heme exporter protein CcmD [Aquabacterium sp. A3]|uniref:heme exporter protein CcmD n=1 Tax=Aquabacterium sp. A3 TaxID=3132829 RepID=UPI003119C4BF